MGALPLANVGFHVSRWLARRFGADREAAARVCAHEAAALLAGGPTADWSDAERAAWERWAPVVLILPGVHDWAPPERAALIRIIREKGGPRESEFVRRFDRHARLRDAVATLARRSPASPA
jgi:hypothetical protein